MQITVAIVGDNLAVCSSLEGVMLESKTCRCVCTSHDARQALQTLPQHKPDVVIMDIELPDISGIECTARLKQQLPETQILILTAHADSERIFRAFEAGASGYLLKSSTPDEIVGAVTEVKNGGVPMSAEIARRVIQFFRKPAALPQRQMPSLTPRETEILDLLAQGYLSKEIAAKLSIGHQTVSFHLANIYQKLHVRSRTEAVIKYLSIPTKNE